jgi:hypothetical protein
MIVSVIITYQVSRSASCSEPASGVARQIAAKIITGSENSSARPNSPSRSAAVSRHPRRANAASAFSVAFMSPALRRLRHRDKWRG